MPEFMIERDIPGAGSLSTAELALAAQRSNDVLRQLGPGIRWLHSYVTGDRIYCVYEAPDALSIHNHARRAGLPVHRVSLVAAVIDPGTARLDSTGTDAARIDINDGGAAASTA